MTSQRKISAIIFDRDNTLVLDEGYLHRPDDFIWAPGADDALCYLHQQGIKCFVATNQGGIGRGIFTVQQMHQFHHRLEEETRKAGGLITDIAYCPHHPLAVTDELKTPCNCRKPEPGMLFQLADTHHLDLSQCIMVGDRQSDCDAGEAAGCLTALSSPTDNLYELIVTLLTSAPDEQK